MACVRHLLLILLESHGPVALAPFGQTTGSEAIATFFQLALCLFGEDRLPRGKLQRQLLSTTPWGQFHISKNEAFFFSSTRSFSSTRLV